MAVALGKAVRSLAQAQWARFSPALSQSYSSVANNHNPAALRDGWPEPQFDREKMTEILDHDNLAMRKEMREFLKDPVFTPR